MGLNIIIFEGTRGVGKSTVARAIRHSIEGSTLMNLTGFKDDGDIGLARIGNYYDTIFQMLDTFQYANASTQLQGDMTLIFDRTFFSEMVYSKLYKKYDFSQAYEYYLRKIFDVSTRMFIFHMTADDASLVSRLERDKTKLFGEVEESVKESRKQADEYDRLFAAVRADMHKLHSPHPAAPERQASVVTINTSGAQEQEIVTIVKEFLRDQGGMHVD